MKPKRMKVNIKWDDESASFRAFKIGTGEKIINYSNLSYGNVDLSKVTNTPAGDIVEEALDDKLESEQTFEHNPGNPSDPANRKPGNLPDKNVTLKGWVTVLE